MHYLLIETFRGGDPVPVYRRLREQGRALPEGLRYVSSWVTEDLTRCYQVVACDQRATLDEWMGRWSDLVDFAVLPVQTSEQVQERLAPRLSG